MRMAVAALALALLAGCGSHGHVTANGNAFLARGGVTGGLSSGDWGDGSSGPSGMHLGCIPGRHFAVYVTSHNRTKKTIAVSTEPSVGENAEIMTRVAMQVVLAPPPPQGDLFVTGFRSWSRTSSAPVAIPPGRDVGIQSDYVMRACSLIPAHEPVIVNRSATIAYRLGRDDATQKIVVRSARIILSRLRPKAPELSAGH
jgi:hypothetical protein